MHSQEAKPLSPAAKLQNRGSKEIRYHFIKVMLALMIVKHAFSGDPCGRRCITLEIGLHILAQAVRR
jgi:hypothetical protein